MSRRQAKHRAQERVPRKRAYSRCCLLFTAVCLLPIACSSPNKRYDLIEAELRTRERELADTRVALEQARNLNRAYAQQAIAQQSQSSPDAQPPNPATPAYVPVKDISLARGTGGVDEDGILGDEGLMVVILPRDEDGSAVKVPARVQIAAWEITTAGIKSPIGNWEVPAEKVRPTWRQGFVSTGYFIGVPWQTFPSTDRVRLAVRLTTLDGRAFESDKDINVRVCIGRAAPSATPVPAPKGAREPLFPDPIPPGVEELPLPSRTSQRNTVLLPPVKQ